MKVLMLQTTGNCNAFFSQVLLFVMCKSSFTQHVCDRPEKLFLSLAVCTDMYQLATRRIADVCVCVCVCVCVVYSICVCGVKGRGVCDECPLPHLSSQTGELNNTLNPTLADLISLFFSLCLSLGVCVCVCVS